jgi:hypothetical protein
MSAERIYKTKLGFKCGKHCAKCGQPVSLDCHGNLTCLKCGGHVKASDGTVYAAYNPRELKTVDGGDFEREAAILSEMGVRSD